MVQSGTATDETLEDPDAGTTIFFPDLSIFDSDVVEEEPEMNRIPSKWALAKIGTFQSRLEAFVRSKELRSGSRIYMSSIPTSAILNIANEVFGFNGWSSEILECDATEEDFNEEKSEYSMKQVSRVRVTLLDGTCIEAEGVGESIRMPHKYMCHGNSKKIAITNGLRNAILRMKLLVTHDEAVKTETT